jgi:hypothetical protein
MNLLSTAHKIVTPRHLDFPQHDPAPDSTMPSCTSTRAAVTLSASSLRADPATAPFVHDGHFAYCGFFHFHDLAAKIYHERTSKTLARLPHAPPPARCCGDLYRYRLEETA